MLESKEKEKKYQPLADSAGKEPVVLSAEEYEALCDKIKLAQQKQQEAERILAFYKASADAMPNPIFIKDDQLRFVFFNRAYREFFGLQEGENIGKRVQDLEYLSPEDRQRFHEEDSTMLEEQAVIQYETSFQVSDGEPTDSLYWSKGFSVSSTGDRGLIGEIVDISREKRLQRELFRSMQTLELLMQDARDASKTDPLTHLFNRNVLTEEVPAAIVRTLSAGQPLCAMLIDIDYFKQINDTHGHPCGDEILQKFAAILKRSFRQTDIAIRYGGDEFLMILPGAKLSQARDIAERLCHTVRTEVMLPDGKPATISVGVAQYQEEDDFLRFFSRADEALYLAKKAGRNRAAVKE